MRRKMGLLALVAGLVLAMGVLVGCDSGGGGSQVTPITALKATPASAAVTLSWTNPADEFDHIEVTVTPASTTAGAPWKVTKPTATYRVTGLTNGKSYTFSVVVVLASGKMSNPVTITATPVASTGGGGTGGSGGSGGTGGSGGSGGTGGLSTQLNGQWIGLCLLNFNVSGNTVGVSSQGITTDTRSITGTGTTVTISNLVGDGVNYTFNYTVSGNTLTLTPTVPLTGWDNNFSKSIASPTATNLQGGVWTNMVSPLTTYTFSGNNYVDHNSGGTDRSGTFTVTPTEITLNQTSPSAATYVEKYWVSSTHFFLTYQSGSHDFGPFKK